MRKQFVPDNPFTSLDKSIMWSVLTQMALNIAPDTTMVAMKRVLETIGPLQTVSLDLPISQRLKPKASFVIIVTLTWCIQTK